MTRTRVPSSSTTSGMSRPTMSWYRGSVILSDAGRFAHSWKPCIRPRSSPCGILHQEMRSEEHTSELQSQSNLVCRLLLEKKKKKNTQEYDQQRHSVRNTRAHTRPAS